MKKIVCILIVLLLIVALIPAFSQQLEVTRWTLSSEKLHSDLRIAVLSDLHNSFYGQNQEQLIAAIHENTPDAILLAGDMADDVQSIDGVRIFLEGLAGRYPVYYVSGNHECTDDNDLAAIKAELRSLGAVVLEGESVLLREDVRIAGADDPMCLYRDEWTAQIDNCRANDGIFTLLLSHRPDRIDSYRRGFDLVISGHAHGGQFRLFDRGLWSPNQGFFPEYTGGFYPAGSGWMFVSRGLAKNLLPRFLNRPELAIIDLKAK